MCIKQLKDYMMPNNPENFPLITWLWVIGMSILGGTVRTLTNLKMGMMPSDMLRRWVVDAIISIFIGMVTFFLCQWAIFPQMLTIALVSLSAHMGTGAIVMLEEKAYQYFKRLDKE